MTPDTDQPPGKIGAWLMELRLPFLTASVAPILLGNVMAWALTGMFLWEIFLLTLAGGVLAHLGANVANDYFDSKSGATDDLNVEFIRPFSGGSRTIQLGYLSPRAVLAGALLFLTSATVIGLYLFLIRGFMVLFLGIIGIFSAFFYTAPPFKLASRGIGEFVIGLCFGTLLVFGSFYVQVQPFLADPFMWDPFLWVTILWNPLMWEPLIASIPVALLITGVLYINCFPDYKADKESGKRTLVVRLGRKRAAKGFVLILAAAHITILVATLLPFVLPLFTTLVLPSMRYYTFIALSSFPLTVMASRFTLKNFDHPLRMIPANASTIFNHMFTTLVLSLAYLLYGIDTYLYNLHWFHILAVGIVLLIISGLIYRNISNKAKAMAQLAAQSG